MPSHRGGVLVVEDNDALRSALVSALSGQRFGELRAAESVAACSTILPGFRPSIVLLDVKLADGDAFDVLRLLAEQAAPLPTVLAMSGVASPEEGFRLAQLGVRSYVSKPLNLTRLEAVLDQLTQAAPDLRPQLRALLGAVPLPSIEEHVRTVLLEEALSKAQGNRRGAARLLAISRQLLQHMLRRLPRLSGAETTSVRVSI